MANLPFLLSYSPKDLDWLKRITESLKPLHLDGLARLWQQSATSGEERLLRDPYAAGYFVILWSPSYSRNPKCRKELALALELRRNGSAKVLVLYLHPCPLPRRLADYRLRPSKNEPLSALPNQDEVLQQIVAEIREELSASPPAGRLSALSYRPGEQRINPTDGLTYVWIPPGIFTRGVSAWDFEAADDEKPAHEVTLTKGFWMGQTPVPQAAYEKVMNANPSRLSGPGRPVEQVTWHEAQQYCRTIGGRLPTEAEWEYAARANSRSSRYDGTDHAIWHEEDSGRRTHPVGKKNPNHWGLYDTLGNVWEWTADCYGPYREGQANDPKGPSTGGARVLRGGSALSESSFCRVSCRMFREPSCRDPECGFRAIWEDPLSPQHLKPIRPVWRDFDQSEEYVPDAQAVIRFESQRVIVSTESNREANISRKSDYSQDIYELIQFFDDRGDWVRERFGIPVWNEMMDLAAAIQKNIECLQAFLAPIPENTDLDSLRRSQFSGRECKPRPGSWTRAVNLTCGGFEYSANNQSTFEIRAEDGSVRRILLPQQAWVSDIWSTGSEVYVPCRSYCWPMVLLEVDPLKGIIARSSMEPEIDIPPTGRCAEYDYLPD